MAKIISEVKLLALLLEAAETGYRNGVGDGRLMAEEQFDGTEQAVLDNREFHTDICLALVDRASIQEVKQ